MPVVEPGEASPKALPLQAVTPGAVISHVTAAQILGLRLPARLRGSDQLHLTQTAGRKAPRRRGVVGHRAALRADDLLAAGGALITGPTRTVVDLASMHRGRGLPVLTDDDLVVVLDGVIEEHATGPRSGLVCLRSQQAVGEDLGRMAHVRGVGRVRRALERCAPAVDSALETRMRLLLQDHGLEGWVTDLELRPRGHRSVWPDLADEEHLIAVQIEGPHHDRPEQRQRDIERARATVAAGWREIRLTWKDMLLDGPGSDPEAVRLIRAARRSTPRAAPPPRRSSAPDRR